VYRVLEATVAYAALICTFYYYYYYYYCSTAAGVFVQRVQISRRDIVVISGIGGRVLASVIGQSIRLAVTGATYASVETRPSHWFAAGPCHTTRFTLLTSTTAFIIQTAAKYNVTLWKHRYCSNTRLHSSSMPTCEAHFAVELAMPRRRGRMHESVQLRIDQNAGVGRHASHYYAVLPITACAAPDHFTAVNVWKLSTALQLANQMLKQVSQLSQRDRAAGWVSYGQKWKTGTGRQYFTAIKVGLSSTTVT